MLKRLAYEAMESSWFVRALRASRGKACAVILMHRFQGPGRSVGHDPQGLRALLRDLREAGIAFVSLEQAITYCTPEATDLPRMAVAFTVDDGYRDFAEVAWPVFREFQCPVSLFVAPEIVSGTDWFWWDKVEHLLRHANATTLDLVIGDQPVTVRWHDEPTRLQALDTLAQRLKSVPVPELYRALQVMSERLAVAIPSQAPPEYRVLDWEALRSLERDGVRIGPHSLTHPVLSRCDDAQASREVIGSVQALRSALQAPVPVFCYPNGRPEDHGAREWQLVRDAGIPFALTTSSGLLSPQLPSQLGSAWAHNLPRIGYTAQAGRIVREFVF